MRLRTALSWLAAAASRHSSPPAAALAATPLLRLAQHQQQPVRLINDVAGVLSLQTVLAGMSSSAQPLVCPESGTVLNVVGIDAEWRPDGGGNFKHASSGRKWSFLSRLLRRSLRRILPPPPSPPPPPPPSPSNWPVSLLQISSRDAVWVVDLLTLTQTLSEDEQIVLAETLSALFSSSAIVKVGLGPASDLKRLSWSYPEILSTQPTFKSVLDIQTLAKRAYPQVSKREMDGLNKLCLREFGQGVDKKYQCSDWGSRPLSAEQLEYAALDAVLMVRLFDSLFAKAAAAGNSAAAGALLSPLLFDYQLQLQQQQQASAKPPLRSVGMTQTKSRIAR